MAGAMTFSLSLPAFAGTTCYVGCAPGPIAPVGIVGGGQSTSPGLAAVSGTQATPSVAPPAKQAVQSSGGLPFTGADIEQIVGIAGVLLVAGMVMVRMSRRRARTVS